MEKQAFKFLSAMPHFKMLPEEDLHQLISQSSRQRIAQDTVFAVQDKTRIDSILVLQKGSLALYDERHAEREPVGFINSGEVFGGITILLNGGISLRTAEAREDSVGYRIPEAVFQDLCARHSDFHDYFLKNFSQNIFDDSLMSIVEAGQAKLFLPQIVPFSFLPEEELDQISGKLKMVQYPAGAVLFHQGRSRVGYLYLLIKGAAEIFYEQDHRKTMAGYLGEGDMFGGISMLLNNGLPVRTLRVIEPSRFYLLSQTDFNDICSRYEAFTEYFTDIFGKRMLQRSYAAIIAKTMRPAEEGAQFLNLTVGSICGINPISGGPQTTIREAAETMATEEIGSLFINSPEGHLMGVVTERDLTHKVVAQGRDINLPAVEIMSAPVYRVEDQSLVFEALMTMMQEDIRHLAVVDGDEKVVGVLSSRDMLMAQGESPLFVLREIAATDSVAELIAIHERQPRLIRSLISSGAKASHLNRFVTAISDAVLKRIIQFVLADSPPPPVPFVFMILGSEGRREQTLKTDQDNAIIFKDVPSAQEAEVQKFFLGFGERVCALLDRVGYAFCTGNVMAQNPQWCQPLAAWKNYFDDWIHTAEAEDLLQASIFFDFRAGYGETAYIEELHQHLFSSLGGWSGFFRHLTENALYFKPPLGFLRNFVVESKGKHRNSPDIKSAMTPIVDLARIYALKHGIDETNTLDRLHQLHLKNVFTRDQFEELERAYSFMMQVRLARQVTAILDEENPPDNYINPKKLTHIEQTMLKEIFKRVEKFQASLGFEFTGLA